MKQLSEFIVHHWPLWLALVIVIILLLANEFLIRRKAGETVSAAAAVDLINNQDAVVIDIRDTEAYKKGHIINSIRATGEDFSQKKMEKYKEQPIILVCERGIQSQTLATKLREQGFKRPMVLAGGISAWYEASLPVVKK